MKIDGCEVCDLLPVKDPIFEAQHWTVSLASDQAYLGRCYVTLKQHKKDMSSLSSEEWLDFAEVVKKLEKVLRKSLDAELFNWGCLMNNAYQEDPAKPHVHWHVRPRYNHPVIFDGVEFGDAAFGHHYDRSQRREVSREFLDKLRSKIVKELE